MSNLFRNHCPVQIGIGVQFTPDFALIQPIHDRMPVILHPEEYYLWLDRDITDPEKLKSLYQPYPADLLDFYRVSSLVNNPRNDSPDCILPLHEYKTPI